MAALKEASLAPPPMTAEAPARAAWVLRLKHVFGLDRAIAYTVLARATQIAGSTGTVLLIFYFLSPVEQGYYYTLLSLVSLQTVFELGFSFVILQMAAHESVHLTLHNDGRIEGSPVAHARLASILQQTLRWYLIAAVMMWTALLPLGLFFFSRRAHAAVGVNWRGPWLLAVSVCAVLFFLDPFFSFLEGCGQIRQVAAARFVQAISGAALAWGTLISRHGLYSPAMVIVAYASVAAGLLWSRRRLLLGLLRHPGGEQVVSWRGEIWPFQWKIAVSWLCSYFTLQVFTPILFAFRGPVEAGQMGMSLSIGGYLSIVVIAWMSTKATPFGQMVRRGEFSEMRRLFSRTLRQSFGLLVGMAATCEAGLVVLHNAAPRFASRLVSPTLFALILLGAAGSFVVQSMAIYLRSFKREPFLVQSMVVAGLTVSLVLLTVKAWGTAGVAASYLLCTGFVGLILAMITFRSWNTRVAVAEPSAVRD